MADRMTPTVEPSPVEQRHRDAVERYLGDILSAFGLAYHEDELAQAFARFERDHMAATPNLEGAEKRARVRVPTNAMIAAGERVLIDRSKSDPEGKWWGYAKKVWAAMEAESLQRSQTEYGWLIEKDGPNGILYAMANVWTPHPHHALRFARQEDAKAFADQFSAPQCDHDVRGWLNGYTRIAEHAWG